MAARGDPGSYMHHGLFRNGRVRNSTVPRVGSNLRWSTTSSPGRQSRGSSTSSSSLDGPASYVTAPSPRRSRSRSTSPGQIYRRPSVRSASPSPVEPSAAGNISPARRSPPSDADSLSFVSAPSSLSPTASDSLPHGDTQQPGRTIDPQTFDAVIAILNAHDNLVAIETTVDPADPGHITAWESYEGDSLDNILLANQARRTRASSNTQGLPETLVWHILISLLKAVVYLHTGAGSNNEQQQQADWMPMVHNAIDPSNIYVGRPTNDQSDIHCKLGGFSNCTVLPNTEDNSAGAAFPVIATEAETGFEAPELVDDIGYPLGPAADIWSIGAVAIFMMTGIHPWDFLRETAFHAHVLRRGATGILKESWRDVPHRRRWIILQGMDKRAEIMAALSADYSELLRAFVEGMLFINPLDRGAAVQVLQDAVRRSGQ